MKIPKIKINDTIEINNNGTINAGGIARGRVRFKPSLIKAENLGLLATTKHISLDITNMNWINKFVGPKKTDPL